MSLVKRTYVDGETVIIAQNLNDIQDAIIQNEEDIATKGTYSKPSGGIPSTDMTTAVQTSLVKADTAYQKPSGGIPATDLASAIQTSLGKADTAYQKPSGGIPSTDLASAVQTSLGKADTALQSSDIDSTLTVAGKAADAKKTGDEISDLKNTLNHKADVIYDTASGDIASFPDGADGLPVKDLTVGIEPVQDLHGYDNPWPAGGGKNKYSDIFSDYTKPVNYYICPITLTEGTWILSATLTGTVLTGVVAGIAKSGTEYNDFVGLVTALTISGSVNNVTLTVDATWTDPKLCVYCPSESAFNAIFDNYQIQLEKGSYKTDFAPYSNICPISGWTGANVSRTGKNLFDISAAGNYAVNANYTTQQDLGNKSENTIIANFGSYGDMVLFKINDLNLSATSVTISADVLLPSKEGLTSNGIVLGLRSRTLNVLKQENVVTTIGTKTHISVTLNISDAGVYDYMRIQPVGNAGAYSSLNCQFSNIQIAFGTSDTAFETFNPASTTIPISWQSEAGTVYGGTLDVTSGVLTMDRAKKTLSEFTWDMTGSTHQFHARGIKDATTRTLSILSSCFATIDGGEPYDSSWNNVIYNVKKNHSTAYSLYVQTADVNTVEAFLSAFGTSEIVYYLETPLVIQLDAVTVNTLLGQNNVWSDTGAVLNCEYPADTKLYIQKINTPTDDDMIADANIASGKYFIVNNNLYISTAAILAGDPIKPGTNCTLTNLAAALNALNS